MDILGFEPLAGIRGCVAAVILHLFQTDCHEMHKLLAVK